MKLNNLKKKLKNHATIIYYMWSIHEQRKKPCESSSGFFFVLFY